MPVRKTHRPFPPKSTPTPGAISKLSQHGRGPSALEGVRVLDLCNVYGLYCGKQLADLGADVVKIERPGGDIARNMPPFVDDVPGANRGVYFLYMNTSKRGITLDIERAEGHEILKRLIATADVMVETTRPGYLREHCLDYPVLQALNPGLVMVSITPYGQNGPHSGFKASDLNTYAMSGLMAGTGEPDKPPVLLAGWQSYAAPSVEAAAGALVALHHRNITGHGQQVDISAQQTLASFTTILGAAQYLDDGTKPRRIGARGLYPCLDGYVLIVLARPEQWELFSKWVHDVTGDPQILDKKFAGRSEDRDRYVSVLDLLITEFSIKFTMTQLFQEGQRRGLTIGPVHGTLDLAKDRQLMDRDYFVRTSDAELGELTIPGAPYLHSASPWRMSRRAPKVGEHNVEVYCGELGMSRSDLVSLATAGVI